MSNFVEPKAKESMLSQVPSIDFDTDTIKAALTTTAGLTSYQYLSSYTVVGTPQALANRTVTNGKYSSDAVAFGTVAAGSTCNVILYKDTGSAATSPVIAFYDSGTNLPIVTNGGSVTFTPDATNGWFTV